MQYNLKGTDVSITPENRAYLEKKLASLDKFVSDLGAARVDIELQFKPLWDGRRFVAEFMLHEPGSGTLRAEARGDALHEAIDLACAELFREMTQSKRKKQDVFRRSALKVKEYLRGLRDRF
jgi:ribosomal subunit interface protein